MWPKAVVRIFAQTQRKAVTVSLSPSEQFVWLYIVIFAAVLPVAKITQRWIRAVCPLGDLCSVSHHRHATNGDVGLEAVAQLMDFTLSQIGIRGP